jgi:Sulfatase
MRPPTDLSSKPSRRQPLLAPGGRYYLLALAFFVAVFAMIPFSIFADASDDWGFPYYQMLYIPALGLVLCVATFVAIRLLALVHAGAAATLACILFCIGVLLLLGHVYAPVKLGPLDGSAMISQEPVLDTIIEAVAAAGFLLLLPALVRGRGVTAAAAFSLALTVVALGYAGVFAYNYHLNARTPKVPVAAAGALTGNVYHLVLDTLQTDAFLAALDDGGLRDEFAGFELFENNISNYITTVGSSASYFTGQYYRGGDYKEWTHRWRDGDRGLLSTLSERGYQVWMYSPFPTWNNQYTDHFWYNVDIYEQDAGFADSGLYDLIHIWLASLAPNVLTNEALPVAARLRDRIFVVLTGKARPLSIREGLHPYAGMMMLRRLLREEEQRPADGQYVYAHAALPHGPFVLDRDCRYVGKRGRGDRARQQQAYLHQTQCALRLVTAFFDELRRLGRFRTATIVLHADTGHGLGFMGAAEARDGPRTLGVRDRRLLSSINALLMIKPPDAAGPLKVSAAPTQLVDLYPTLLAILGLEPSYPPDGRSVYSVRPDERRDARFGFDPNDKQGGDIVEVRVEQPTDLTRSPLTVLGPAASPTTWAGD